MAASSGFRYIPGHAGSGNAVCIAPSHSHVYHNGQRQRYIRLLLPPLLFDQNAAKAGGYSSPFFISSPKHRMYVLYQVTIIWVTACIFHD
jgi:hypothetical protein